MLQNPIFLLSISTIIAAIPAAIWLVILFAQADQSKKTIALVFGLGCLTAPALLGLQYVWDIFPRFNLASIVEQSFHTQSTMFIAMFVLFGAMEEIIKLYVLTIVDKKTLLIKTVNNTIRYSLAAALGFAFTENIYYLYQFWPSISTGELVGMYIFRSVFTACAHMIFSGVFGYFYAMGKFSIEITKHKKLTEGVGGITKIISKLFNIPASHAYQQRMVLKGLFLAIGMHATYNYLLQLGYVYPVVIFVILAGTYMWYLMRRKSGSLLIRTDVTTKKTSSIAEKDEEVIIELLGMWFTEKRYVDVVKICERLLERDPDNKIVKLFKAKSKDKMDNSNPYKKILGSILKSRDDLTQSERNKLTKHIEEKEMFAKVKMMVKKQVEKEGKKYKKYKPKLKDIKKTKKKEKEDTSVFKMD